jgi:hypothetical protein
MGRKKGESGESGVGRPVGRASKTEGQNSPPSGTDNNKVVARPTVPDIIPDVRLAAKFFSADALRTLDAIMMDPTRDSRARAAAAQALLDRGWGRPAQAITDAEGGALKVGVIILPAERDEDKKDE